MKKINDRFEAVRGKTTVKWRTDELMQILRGEKLRAELAERGIEASDDDAVAEHALMRTIRTPNPTRVEAPPIFRRGTHTSTACAMTKSILRYSRPTSFSRF
jgi:hypothetical protein